MGKNCDRRHIIKPAFILVYILLFAFISFGSIGMVSYASSGVSDVVSSDVIYMVNPLYASEITENDLRRATDENQITPQKLSEAVKCKNAEEMTEVLRTAMVNREATANVYFELPGTSYTAKSLIDMEYDVLNRAVGHTGQGNEGDYLKWGYSGLGMQTTYGKATGNTVGSFSYYFTFYTNTSQEAQVTSKVNQIAKNLSLSSKSDYEKIRLVYKYVVSNVKYDYGSSVMKYSCYNAAIHNSAVCQGYSLLVYRLLNDAGVDCRLVAGNTKSGAHGWNIVKIGNLYYNADSTWDAGKSESEYSYFLKCDSNFKGHTRWAEYSDAAFSSVYVMSNSDYDTSALGAALKELKLKQDNLTLTVGKSSTLKVSTTPNIPLNKLKFTSSNKKVATVDDSGKVTAKKAGTCVITVSDSQGTFSDKCYVTVNSGKKTNVKSVKLNKKNVKIKVGKSIKLKATVKPKNATDVRVSFKSSNKKVATVDKNGLVKAKKKGTCTITVTTKDGKKTAKCKVTVK